MTSYDPKLMLAQARVAELEAELADLRASSVVVRERCDYCWIDGRPNPLLATEDCSECDNGWQLAEGVTPHTWSAMDRRWQFYSIPARLIEGEA